MAEYDIGDALTVYVDFKDADDAAADPTAVTLTVKKPSGANSSPSVTHPSTGRYEGVVEIDMAGTWFYRWAGTGALQAAEEGEFYVRPRRVP
jgi:uncharacterized protein YfaS (alpha-2-macroglobulin family)